MSGPWMGEMADLVDAAQMGAQAPPVSKAAHPQPTVAPSSIDDTPTEPATSPRMIDPQVREWPAELQLPTREIGPRPEPEVYPTRFIVNDGPWTPEEHEEVNSVKQLKLVTTKHGIEKLVKKPKGRIESLFKAWQTGRQKSKVEASKIIQQSLMVHLPRELHPCELFQMFTKLFVRMILPRLQRRSRSFQESPSNNRQR